MTTLMDALATATATLPRAYKVGTVPVKPPYPYVVWSALMLEDTAPTLDGQGSVRWIQVVAQTFGRTADSVSGASESFRAALVGKWLTWDGHEAGPLTAELRPTPITRDPDDSGVLGSTSTYTATAQET